MKTEKKFSGWNCTEKLELSGKANISAVIKYTTTMMFSHVQFELILKQVKWKPSGIIRNQVLWEKRMESLLKEGLAKEEQKNPGCLLEGLTHRRKDGYVS